MCVVLLIGVCSEEKDGDEGVLIGLVGGSDDMGLFGGRESWLVVGGISEGLGLDGEDVRRGSG